ncbi:MAG: hypothetical protein N2690_11955, partial [Rhodocyclaceae bacterium]|nr:hypothetical protein [Rhodocyclaceae bacterium]
MQVRLTRELAPALVSGGYLLLLFVGFQIDLVEAWRVIAALIALLALIAWVLALKRARAIADTPTAKIASAAQGYV